MYLQSLIVRSNTRHQTSPWLPYGATWSTPMMSPSPVPWRQAGNVAIVPHMKQPRGLSNRSYHHQAHQPGRADRILSLYTPRYGKVKALQGQSSPQKQARWTRELLTHSQLLLARGRNLDIITQAQTINTILS